MNSLAPPPHPELYSQGPLTVPCPQPPHTSLRLDMGCPVSRNRQTSYFKVCSPTDRVSTTLACRGKSLPLFGMSLTCASGGQKVINRNNARLRPLHTLSHPSLGLFMQRNDDKENTWQSAAGGKEGPKHTEKRCSFVTRDVGTGTGYSLLLEDLAIRFAIVLVSRVLSSCSLGAWVHITPQHAKPSHVDAVSMAQSVLEFPRPRKVVCIGRLPGLPPALCDPNVQLSHTSEPKHVAR
jgi:hypothetical protein